ncbi:hypothetical protein B7463_g2202, partial [Scytalidium lignicola]
MQLEVEPPMEEVQNDEGKGDRDIDEGEEEDTMKCIVREFESRYNAKGKLIKREVGDKKKSGEEEDEEEDEVPDSAMKATKRYDVSGALSGAEVEIHSQHIQNALREVIQKYPFCSFEGKVVLLSNKTMPLALACIYHYRNELEEYAEKLDTITAKLHVSLAIKLMEREMHQYIRRLRLLMEDRASPSVDFETAWLIFKPGQLLYIPDEDKWKQRITKLVSIKYVEKSEVFSPPKKYWEITTRTFACNGSSFGYIERSRYIYKFSGEKLITELPIYPLKYHPNERVVREEQLLRGKKYRSLAGVGYRAYDGIAKRVDKERVNGLFDVRDVYPEVDIYFQGRIIMDCKTFIEHRTSSGICLNSYQSSTLDEIPEEDLLISNNQVPGFALNDKYWCWFYVDLIHDIKFDDSAWDSLIISSKQKRVIKALTTQHLAEGDDFDDMIQGKGKGCIFLFHGDPGVGKTFTVEGIADNIKRPLYVVMSGDLGSDSETLEKNLTATLRLAIRWKAILLLDEADVFLEQRSSNDIARNGLVSVFLRALEYYPGILFLTTNRITSFDIAFKSRIHLALKYPELDETVRAKIWKLFLHRTSHFREEDWPEEVMKRLAHFQLNGRQIKNTVRTAQTLALSEGRQLSYKDVSTVLETVLQFEQDLNEETQDTAIFAPGRQASFGLRRDSWKYSIPRKPQHVLSALE